MQGKQNIFVLAATNRPQSIDRAFRRRFNKLLYIPLPTEEEREDLFRYEFSKFKNTLLSKDYAFLASLTDNYSPADITRIISDVRTQRLRRANLARYFVRDKVTSGWWWPAMAKDKGSKYLTTKYINDTQFFLPPATMLDVEMSFKVMKKTSDKEDLNALKKFCEKFGHDRS